MKQVRKIFAFVVAFVAALAIVTPAFAATDGTITVGTNFKDQTYTLYKLFDATTVDGRADDADGISYTLMNGKTDLIATVNGQEVNGNQWFTLTNGNVTANSITFNDAFRAWAEQYGSKIGDEGLTASKDNDPNIKWTGLGEGYYFITTTTGSLVTVNSIAPDVNVVDKNSIPGVNKTITAVEGNLGSLDADGKNAIAQLGKKVTFTGVVDFGKGSKNVKFHDVMGSGLELVPDNITVTFKKGNETVEITGGYTIQSTPDDGDTFTIKFADGIAETVKATITYQATVKSDALTVTSDNGKNTATLTYGDSNTPTQGSSTQVYNAKITITKKDGEGAPLPDAGFVIKNEAGKYYKLQNNVVTWVDAEKDATEYKSDNSGAVTAFTGLCNGKYTLVEKTVPKGYNKAQDKEFTIAEKNFTQVNLEQAADVTNNIGTEMPSTGGIGTTIFYVVGGVMVAGAVVFLLTKRRMAGTAE